MGSSGEGPRPFTQRQARTIFLRVPYSEWNLVSSGRKREFRGSPNMCSQLWDVETPTPVVAWAEFPARGHKRLMMVLEEQWREPLGAISPASLEREGQPDIAHFRRYWMQRTKKPFPPTRIISVYRVRPWGAGDAAHMGDRLLQRLYGDFLAA